MSSEMANEVENETENQEKEQEHLVKETADFQNPKDL